MTNITLKIDMLSCAWFVLYGTMSRFVPHGTNKKCGMRKTFHDGEYKNE
jgi:hypothetical protein